MAEELSILDEAFSFDDLNENSFPGVSGDDFDNSMLSAFAVAVTPDDVVVHIDDSLKQTSLTMPSGSVLYPSRWKMPTKQELEAIWQF